MPTSGAIVNGAPIQQPSYLPGDPNSFQWGQGQWQGTGGGNTAQQYYAFKKFAQLFGHNPTQSELDQFSPFYASGDPNKTNNGVGDQALSSYFQQQQAIQNAPQQEAQQIQAQIPILQDLINQQTTGTIKNLTDPNSDQYKQFAGNLNNFGITPSSGAFQAGLGSKIGGAANDFISQAIGGVALPIASTYAQGATMPYQDAVSRPGQMFQNNMQMQNFLTQAQMAQAAAEQAAPSDFQKGLGYAGGITQAAGNIGQAAGGASQVTSYICLAMIDAGLLCESDLDDFHVHIMPALFKKARAFWHYAKYGEALSLYAKSGRINWNDYKPFLFDRVMAEPNAEKAVDLYAAGCEMLCERYAQHLWDERVYRTSILDSLRFLPRLFGYKPFRDALLKCIRLKFMFVVDRPKCEENHGF